MSAVSVIGLKWRYPQPGVKDSRCKKMVYYFTPDATNRQNAVCFDNRKAGEPKLEKCAGKAAFRLRVAFRFGVVAAGSGLDCETKNYTGYLSADQQRNLGETNVFQ